MHPGIFIRGLPYEDNRTGGPKEYKQLYFLSFSFE